MYTYILCIHPALVDQTYSCTYSYTQTCDLKISPLKNVFMCMSTWGTMPEKTQKSVFHPPGTEVTVISCSKRVWELNSSRLEEQQAHS